MAKHVYAGRDRFRLDGRVAVVTGGCGLLGQRFCQALSQAGAKVVVADTQPDSVAAVAHEMDATGFVVDVTDAASVQELQAFVRKDFDGLDILVNSAAINDRFDEGAAARLSRFEDYPLQAWRDQLEVNLTGSFLPCQVLGSDMARRGGGSIINIGSTYGLVAPDQGIYKRPDGEQTFYKSAGYAASKGGVVMLTRFIATYWAQENVRANVICPGGVAQNQDPHFVSQYSARAPMGRMAEADEISGAAVFLASDAASYVTGAVLCVDGGWTAW